MKTAQLVPTHKNGRCTKCNDYARDCICCVSCECGGELETDEMTCPDCETIYCVDCYTEIVWDETKGHLHLNPEQLCHLSQFWQPV